MRVLIIVNALLFFVLPLSANDALLKAKSLNTEGMSLYRQQNYEKAAEKFKKAVAAYPGYSKVQYNLACTYALLVQCGEISYFGFNIDTVFAQLKRAVALDPQIKNKALADKDFDNVRSYFGFYAVLGMDLSDSITLRNILPSITLYTGECSPGAYGCSYFTLLNDGTFTFKNALDPFFDGTPKEREIYDKKYSGRYYHKDNLVILKFSSGEEQKYNFPDARGIMMSTDRVHTLSDRDPDPCSA